MESRMISLCMNGNIHRRMFGTCRTLLANAPESRFEEKLTKHREDSLPPRSSYNEKNRRFLKPKSNVDRAAWRNAESNSESMNLTNSRGSDEQRKEKILLDSQRAKERLDMQKQMGRIWKEGDVYNAHDLGPVEMKKWKTPQAMGKRTRDICDMLQLNPLHHYKNFSLMSEFVTETGRIKGRNDTGLRPLNQRRMAKAIRRAIGCGLMPSTYRHPELLRRDFAEKSTFRSLTSI